MGEIGWEPDAGGEGNGIARRELIRRSVAAGSLAWAAPAITGLGRASAQQSPAPGGGDAGGNPTPTACAAVGGRSSPASALRLADEQRRLLPLAACPRRMQQHLRSGRLWPRLTCLSRQALSTTQFIRTCRFIEPPQPGPVLFECTTGPQGVPCDCICIPS